jgi:hypothetical protein
MLYKRKQNKIICKSMLYIHHVFKNYLASNYLESLQISLCQNVSV